MAETIIVSATFVQKKGLYMKKNLRIYEVKSEYIKYLSNYQKHIFAQSEGKDKRKYIGIVFEIKGLKYFAPLSSYKDKHNKMKEGVDFIKIKDWAAIIAWVAAFILPLLTYFGASGAFFGFINSINYIFSFVVGFVVYVILMKTSLAGKSFVTEEEHEAFTERA